MRHRLARIVALLAVVGAAAWLGTKLLLGPQVQVSTVVQRDFVQSVVASGRVEAPHRVSLAAQITGTVQRVPVAEGQTVAAGQPLVVLDATEARAAAAQADATVLQAQARLRQLREVQAPVAEQTLRQARVALDNARAQWQRSAELFKQGFIGQSALDESRKAVDLNEAQLRSAQTQLETARVGGSDHAMATAALAAAQAAALQARSRLGYTNITAPVAGTLISRDVEAGDVVQPGKVLMTLSPAGETQLVVDIDEKSLHLIKVGQAAEASADAFADRRFAARLSYINPGVDAQKGSVEVKLTVPATPDYLTQDMTVSVNIRVAERPQAVLVTTDSVHDLDTAKPWVLVVDRGRARRQAVRIGLRANGHCEVLAGLKAGDLVVPSLGSPIRDGSRLRPVVAAG